MAVLGKKRPWLLWSFNGRPTLPQLGRETDAIAESAYKSAGRLHIRVQVGWKSGPAKAGPAAPPLTCAVYDLAGWQWMTARTP